MKVKMNWYTSVLKKYAVFSGRARRQEFWTFIIISLLISFVLGFTEGFIKGAIEGFIEGFIEGYLSGHNADVQDIPGALNVRDALNTGSFGNGIIPAIYSLLIFIPTLAVMVRRFNDSGHGAGWLALPVITMVSSAIGGGILTAIRLGFIPGNVSILAVSGGFILITIIFAVITIIFLLKDSQAGENSYGPNPKEEAVAQEEISPDNMG